jgi:threonine dehydrogenase-like Zn-dependent dehydrogenase
MCRNGQYSECGINERDGYGRESFRIDVEFAVRVDPLLREAGVLLEPASILTKAWDHIERIGQRTRSWAPKVVLVTGAGTIGLLASLMARQRGLELHVYDRDEADKKRSLVSQLGGHFHAALEQACSLNADITIECTGASQVIAALIGRTAANGIMCLAGLSSGMHCIRYDFSSLNRTMVLQNDVMFGTVNANRRHYELAAASLSQADQAWLAGLISRRVALDDWQLALERRPGDIKVVIDFTI